MNDEPFRFCFAHRRNFENFLSRRSRAGRGDESRSGATRSAALVVTPPPLGTSHEIFGISARSLAAPKQATAHQKQYRHLGVVNIRLLSSSPHASARVAISSLIGMPHYHQTPICPVASTRSRSCLHDRRQRGRPQASASPMLRTAHSHCSQSPQDPVACPPLRAARRSSQKANSCVHSTV